MEMDMFGSQIEIPTFNSHKRNKSIKNFLYKLDRLAKNLKRYPYKWKTTLSIQLRSITSDC